MKKIKMQFKNIRIIDLTHFISSDMPVYPGTGKPVITDEYSIDEFGFVEKRIDFYSHTGTHVDAPAHILKRGKTLDALSVEHFSGNGFLLKIDGDKKKTVEIDDLKPHEEDIKRAEFLLVFFGWERLWGKDAYFADFPVFTLEAARWLTGFNLKGVGVDAISVDKEGAEKFPIHETFLKKNIIIIENLTNLKALDNQRFIFFCFPLKIKEADGSPVRAVAFIED